MECLEFMILFRRFHLPSADSRSLLVFVATGLDPPLKLAGKISQIRCFGIVSTAANAHVLL